MTPKKKAKELVDRYYWTFGDGYLGDQHIQCALIAVDEILNNNTKIPANVNGLHTVENTYYWLEVKNEIENYDRTTILNLLQ